jgi:hypothetical protein
MGGSQRAVLVELRKDIDRLEQRIDAQEAVVGAMRQALGKLEGEAAILVASFDRSAGVVMAEAQARVDVRKTQELAVVEEVKLSRQHRRQLAVKGAAVLTGLWAIIASALASRC